MRKKIKKQPVRRRPGVRLETVGKRWFIVLPRGTDVQRFIQALGVAAYNSAAPTGLGALAKPDARGVQLSDLDLLIERNSVNGYLRLQMEYGNGRECRLYVTQVPGAKLEFNRHQYENVRGGNVAQLFKDALEAYNKELPKDLKPIEMGV
ncbi:MAG: hypothetical protein HY976_00630 [Candidatus Kerfeldbacteria bacterium]|nr:hypothetical protein [Candidatus Kerfeldbacteria bacterium]